MPKLVRRALMALFVPVLLCVSAQASLAACPAEHFVNDAGSAMMVAARRNSASAFTGVASRYTDLNAIALFALGQHRADLPKSMEAKYVALTRNFVGRFMAKHASRFKGSGMSVTDCSGSGKSFTVNARLSGGQKLVFRLMKTRGGYKVRDLNVASVWLAQQLRTTFVGVIRRNGGGMDALFRYLRDYS